MSQANWVKSTRFTFIVAGALLFALASLLFDISYPPRSYADDEPSTTYPGAGLFTGADHVYGLYDVEKTVDGTTYRWSGAHVTWTYTYLANLGRYVDISLRLGAWANPGTPPTVTISLNGKQAAQFAVTPDFQVYTTTLDTLQDPNPYLDPAYVQVDLTTTTFTPPGETRQLGVAVDWVHLQVHKSHTEMALDVAIWAVLGGLLLLIAEARLGLRWAGVYGVLGLISFVATELAAIPRAIPTSVEVALVGLCWLLVVWLAPRKSPGWGLGLAACLLWLVFAGHLLGDWQIDDAYISYRYAWNLVHGNNLVYNPGEIVEGYTNFLWTLVSAGGIWGGFSPAGVSLAGTIAASQGLVALTFLLGAKLLPGRPAWWLAAALLLSVDSALVTYGPRGSGIEAAPFAFLCLAPVVALWARPHVKWRVIAGVLLALASLTRPEGLLVAALLLALRAWLDRRGKLPAGRLLPAALLPYLAVVAPYELWRITFYGYPFPNTFYAKTGLTPAVLRRGAEYGLQFVTRHWLVAGLVIAWAVLVAYQLLRKRRTQRPDVPDVPGAAAKSRLAPNTGLAATLAILAAVYALYIVYIGGDWFPSERFFVPVLAPAVLLATVSAAMLLDWLARGRARAIVYAIAGLVMVVYLGFELQQQSPNGTLLGLFQPNAYANPLDGSLADSTHKPNIYIDRWGAAGLWLRVNTPSDAWTAARGAGAIAYYSQRSTIDMYGLNDIHIAHMQIANMGESVAGHEKSDPAYVLARQPDYMLASWDDYFEPVAVQFNQEYTDKTVQSPIGPEVKWSVLK